MKSITTIVTAAFLAATPAFALDIPSPSSSDSRVRSVNYNEWDVVRVIGTVRTTVQIVFDQSEEILDVAAGDNVAWEFKPRNNILYLKPRELHPPSNVQVATVRADGTTRTYSFELITREGEITVNNRDVYFQIRFRYPRDEAEARRVERAAQRQAAQEQAARSRLSASVAHSGTKNWQYLAAGSRSQQPAKVFDNGDLTVLTFKRSTRLPSVFLVGTDGEERLANTTVHGNEIIVHGVSNEIRLRLGREVTAIYNMGVGKGHTSISTSTTSHRVEREVIGGSN
ncbi:type IV secretion system protein VirB9 [Epibacterium ulvae]|uniref:Type IV secretion system protein VirB9 n=1 Tax=Epibacterium ulvae TaxID=1156985 RepID=A0A1G5RJF4_9RHOB|nr:P-type conjugative transfer protein VirB9 [Epibacterium ulvae]SCZ73501.1 type IV secretion system protein VirB9 [Epibacterium ulvae]